MQKRIKLLKPLLDVDLLLAVEESKTVLISEMKWLRKPFGWKEQIEREADFRKGLEQLSKIRNFLEANPKYLEQNRKLPRPERIRTHRLPSYRARSVLVA